MKYKFRAWYPILSIMFYDVRVGGFDGDTVPTHFDTTRNDHCWLPIWGDNKDGVVMQYTGLNDKNGVESCAGDIIKGIVGNHIWYYLIEKHKGFGSNLFLTTRYRNFEIVDDLYTWGDFYVNEGRSIIGLDFDKYEIIGNIYENPEILKETPNDR